MRSQRDNVVSSDYLVAQIFDKASWRRVYGTAGQPVKWAARFALQTFLGFPRMLHVENTPGPIGQWLCWLADDHSDRKAAQWGQVFPAQITSTSPVQATPVLDASSGTSVLDTTLSAMNVYMIDGTTPSRGDYVMVVAGTDLAGQRAIAFKGGGGAGQIAFKVSGGTPGPTCAGFQVDDFTGVAVPGGITTTLLVERTGSTGIGLGQMVYAQRAPSGDSGGQLCYTFVLPLGVCS